MTAVLRKGYAAARAGNVDFLRTSSAILDRIIDGQSSPQPQGLGIGRPANRRPIKEVMNRRSENFALLKVVHFYFHSRLCF